MDYMTPFERKQCAGQLKAMDTPALKELAQMMELCNETEHEALSLILDELKYRGVKVEKLTLIERADVPEEQERVS